MPACYTRLVSFWLFGGWFMEAIEAIKAAAAVAGVPTTHIGPAMGKAATYVATMAGKGSTPRVDTAARMADVLGYALALVPVGDVPASAIVIDAPEVDTDAAARAVLERRRERLRRELAEADALLG